MKDICQKYVNKINKDINSLKFLYEEKQLNFNLSFNEQANIVEKERNEIKVLVYKNEIKILKNENINNYIITEIIIKEKDVNKNIRILNSYEEYLRT